MAWHGRQFLNKKKKTLVYLPSLCCYVGISENCQKCIVLHSWDFEVLVCENKSKSNS